MCACIAYKSMRKSYNIKDIGDDYAGYHERVKGEFGDKIIAYNAEMRHGAYENAFQFSEAFVKSFSANYKTYDMSKDVDLLDLIFGIPSVQHMVDLSGKGTLSRMRIRFMCMFLVYIPDG